MVLSLCFTLPLMELPFMYVHVCHGLLLKLLKNSFSFASVYFLVSQSLLPDYQRLLSSMPARRLNTSKLIENSGEFL